MSGDGLGVRITCTCNEWGKSAHQIFRAQIAHTILTGKEYTGEGFHFCPWCGRTLHAVASTDSITQPQPAAGGEE